MIQTLAAVALVLSIPMLVVQSDELRRSDETLTRQVLRFAGTGERSLAIRNIDGSIRVEGMSGGDVQVEVRRLIRADSDASLRRGAEAVTLATIDGRPDVALEVREDGEAQCGITTGTRRLTQRNRSYRVQYDLNVRVPEGVRLSLCTINGAEIEVRNTSGDFAVNNVNGRIRLIGVRGSGDAETVNGPVEAELLQVPRRDLRFKTVNGDVAVTWPRDLSADLRMKTMNGAVFTDFDVQTLPAVVPVEGQRRDGRFVYRSSNLTSVRVGRGGPQVTLESLNGDIRVLRAQR
jgi:hypothetical protein